MTNVIEKIDNNYLDVLNQIADDICIDTYYFCVPSRYLWDHWSEFVDKENNDD